MIQQHYHNTKLLTRTAHNYSLDKNVVLMWCLKLQSQFRTWMLFLGLCFDSNECFCTCDKITDWDTTSLTSRSKGDFWATSALTSDANINFRIMIINVKNDSSLFAVSGPIKHELDYFTCDFHAFSLSPIYIDIGKIVMW